MFKGISFSIIEFSVDLAAKRSKILSNLIKKNKGILIDKAESKLYFPLLVSSIP